MRSALLGAGIVLTGVLACGAMLGASWLFLSIVIWPAIICVGLGLNLPEKKWHPSASDRALLEAVKRREND